MADVRARGQLILITGLTIGALLLALILLMNTVIYTENLATRGAAVGGQEAIEYRSDIVGTAITGMEEENKGGSPDINRVEDDIAVSEALFREHYIERATVTRASFVSYVMGIRIYQETSSEFTSGASDGNWTVATDVSNTRNYSMTVNRADLASTNEGDLDGAFNVSVSPTDASSPKWRGYVYENGDGDIAVAVANGSTNEVCSVSKNSATISFTEGTLEDSVCPGLDWAENVDAPYDIEYHYGENATGTYSMMVDGTAGNPPKNEDIIYSVTVDLYYESPNLLYEAQVRVAPGEPT